MMRPKIVEDWIYTDRVKYPDHIELGKAGTRLSVAFNADHPEEAIDRIDEALAIRDYAVNALMKSIEKEVKGRG